METMLEARVNGIGDIHRAESSWDQVLEVLQPFNGKELSYSRIQEGENSFLFNLGSFIKEGILYIPRGEILLIEDSPLLTKQVPREVKQSHREGSEYFVDLEKYRGQIEEDSEKDPEKRKILAINRRKNFKIPTDNFDEDEVTLWLFKNNAKDYGDFLKNLGINEIPVLLVDRNYVNDQRRPFARQLYLNGSEGGSGINGYRGLAYDTRVFGRIK